MDTFTVKILEPKAKRILDDLASLNLIEVTEGVRPKRPNRRFGSMKGLVVQISDDFDAPVEDFQDYM